MFAITTDTGGDLPLEMLREHGVGLMSLHYTVDGQTYDAYHPMPDRDFYERMRGGAMPTTAQVNPDEARQVLEQALATHDEVLHIAFSSGLSGSCQSARIAAQELEEQNPGKRIVVVDSLAASLGQGLLVHYALRLREQGRSLDETARWCEDNKLHIAHLFTVDDLFHLHRGGRVSRTAAVVGSVLGIKPVLHVDDAGHLVAVGKVRGRRRALDELVRRMGEQTGGAVPDTVFISHGDCAEDADYVARRVQQTFGTAPSRVEVIGPAIGAHAGPGTVALFFLAARR